MRKVAIVALVLAMWVAAVAVTGSGRDPATAQSSGVIVGKAHAGFTPSLSGDEPIVILAIGSGARPGDDVMHSLADSIHVIFIDPSTGRASMIGVPRDSYVPVEGHGTQKINSSMFYGGPELLADTIEQLGGITIDYWALTTFWGFTDMIDDVGGLTIDVPFSMQDSYARADFEPGVQEFSGKDAFAFARTRHDLQQGDFARQENGGRLFLAALQQFQEEYTADQSRLFTWVGAGLRNMDTTLSLDEVMDLAFTASTVKAKRVQNLVLPGNAQTVGGLSVVLLDMGRTQAIFSDVATDAKVGKKNVPPSPTANEV